MIIVQLERCVDIFWCTEREEKETDILYLPDVRREAAAQYANLTRSRTSTRLLNIFNCGL